MWSRRRERSTACSCPASTWFPYSIHPSIGWRGGPPSPIPPKLRSRAISPKHGGLWQNNTTMILADLHDQDLASRIGGRASLDNLFRRNAERRPNALALVDPPNREAFTGGPPRRLTYAQADHVVSALAGRLRRLRLHTDSLVAFQVANSVESVLTLLAVLRAGLIAMPLPLLWRRADLKNALSQVGARALIVSGHIA